MNKCEWCKNEFEALDPAQAYCKRGHANKARIKRNEEVERLKNAGRCPTPFKRTFVNSEHAAMFYDKEDQRLYKCPCGAMHLTTIKKFKKV